VHEWALAEAVISTALKIAEREGLRRITEIKLRIGELQQIDLEAFRFALAQIGGQYAIQAEYSFEIEAAEFRCRACGYTWPFDREALDPDAREAVHVIPEVAHAFIRCPRCGSPDFEEVSGRGVWVVSVRGEGGVERPEARRDR